MSKLSEVSGVNRAARSLSGQRHRFTASTRHSSNTRLAKRAVRRNLCRPSVTGTAAMQTKKKSQTTVCRSLTATTTECSFELGCMRKPILNQLWRSTSAAETKRARDQGSGIRKSFRLRFFLGDIVTAKRCRKDVTKGSFRLLLFAGLVGDLEIVLHAEDA